MGYSPWDCKDSYTTDCAYNTHTVKDFSIVSEAKVDVFLDLSCFLFDSTNVHNLICFLHLFKSQFLHLEVISSCIAENNLEGFWSKPYKHAKWAQLWHSLNILKEVGIPGHLTECSLTERGPLEKGMAKHFSILALRTPWTVWKGKMIQHWKRNSTGQ